MIERSLLLRSEVILWIRSVSPRGAALFPPRLPPCCLAPTTSPPHHLGLQHLRARRGSMSRRQLGVCDERHALIWKPV